MHKILFPLAALPTPSSCILGGLLLRGGGERGRERGGESGRKKKGKEKEVKGGNWRGQLPPQYFGLEPLLTCSRCAALSVKTRRFAANEQKGTTLRPLWPLLLRCAMRCRRHIDFCPRTKGDQSRDRAFCRAADHAEYARVIDIRCLCFRRDENEAKRRT